MIACTHGFATNGLIGRLLATSRQHGGRHNNNRSVLHGMSLLKSVKRRLNRSVLRYVKTFCQVQKRN